MKRILYDLCRFFFPRLKNLAKGVGTQGALPRQATPVVPKGRQKVELYQFVDLVEDLRLVQKSLDTISTSSLFRSLGNGPAVKTEEILRLKVVD